LWVYRSAMSLGGRSVVTETATHGCARIRERAGVGSEALRRATRCARSSRCCPRRSLSFPRPSWATGGTAQRGWSPGRTQGLPRENRGSAGGDRSPVVRDTPRRSRFWAPERRSRTLPGEHRYPSSRVPCSGCCAAAVRALWSAAHARARSFRQCRRERMQSVRDDDRLRRCDDRVVVPGSPILRCRRRPSGETCGRAWRTDRGRRQGDSASGNVVKHRTMVGHAAFVRSGAGHRDRRLAQCRVAAGIGRGVGDRVDAPAARAAALASEQELAVVGAECRP